MPEAVVEQKDVLDFATLLAAIPGDAPTGMDLRKDTSTRSLYYATRYARDAAKVAERPLDRGQKPKVDDPAPDWRPVMQHACKALAEKTKDLELTAYLIEALLRLHGFAGLHNGFRLARELVERFWDRLYPMPDEDGMVTRLAPLIGLNGDEADGTLQAPIGRVPITEGASAGPFSSHDYTGALGLQKTSDSTERQRRIDEGAVTLEMLQKAVAETPAAFYQALVHDLTQCTEQLDLLGKALDERCKDPPSRTSAIRTVLEGCLGAVKVLAVDKIKIEPPEEMKPPIVNGPGPGGASSPVPGTVRTRDEALRMLQEVAKFFERTDPLSLLRYPVEQVVRWGKMQPPELLAELIPDEGAREGLFRQLGIKPPPPPEEK